MRQIQACETCCAPHRDESERCPECVFAFGKILSYRNAIDLYYREMRAMLRRARRDAYNASLVCLTIPGMRRAISALRADVRALRAEVRDRTEENEGDVFAPLRLVAGAA